MKKFIILFLAMFLMPVSQVKAAESRERLSVKSDKVTVDIDESIFYYSSGSKYGVFYKNKYVYGKYSYCLNFDDLIVNTSDHKPANPMLQYDEEEWRRYSLYAMYGERRFEQTNNMKYRYAAQALIHEETYPKNKKMLFYDYSTSAKSEFNVDSYKKELVDLYKAHILNPDINMDDVDFKVGQTYKFEDINKVISKYIVESSTDNIEVKVIDNFVEVTVLESGPASFSLATDDYTKDGDVVLWASNKYQDLITVTSFNPAKVDYTLTSSDNLGSLQVNKLDSDTKEYLSGAKFELYRQVGDNYELDQEFVIDKSITISDLKLGNYKLVEIEAPTGYGLSNNEYEFAISKDKELIVIDVENSKILPKTGFTNGYFSSLSTLLVGLLITRHYYAKKRSFKR